MIMRTLSERGFTAMLKYTRLNYDTTETAVCRLLTGRIPDAVETRRCGWDPAVSFGSEYSWQVRRLSSSTTEADQGNRVPAW